MNELAQADITPADRADAATKVVLLRLLTAINDNQAGVLLNEDPECLHDFRVAVRRTRSALGQIKGVFPDNTVRRFAPRFAWLGQITSEARDLDVYLLGFDALIADLPATVQNQLEPLRGFLQRRAEAAHAELANQLESVSYQQLISIWQAFLSAPCPKRPTAPNALSPVKAIADQRIWKLFRRVLNEGRAIEADTPAETIHNLRKTCKKLRYLLEFFRTLYPADDISRPIKQLKKLQDYLGTFQDVHTHQVMLRQFSAAMRYDSAVPTETLLALGVLLAQLEIQQAVLRQAFPEHFEPFSSGGNRERFKALFKPSVS
jgi:CHAD domain-containing protein